MAVGVISACSFSLTARDEATDGGTDAPPDAGPCQVVNEASCAGTELRVCRVVGQLPESTPCTWSCVDGALPHCGRLVPAAGAVAPDDLVADSMLAANVTITGETTLYSGTGSDGTGSAGEISNLRGSGFGYVDDIEFQIVGTVAVFRFTNLTITGTLMLRGSNAVALVATGNIVVDGVLVASGTCSGSAAGPGGFIGGLGRKTAAGPGGGVGATSNTGGGGGGGHGAVGGTGGIAAGGGVHGDPLIALVGGGGGGGGGSNNDSALAGGGGGGAVQLVANGTITFGDGGINAGGCGGNGSGNYGGGGGGAGGTILIEAAKVELGAVTTLAVNGGGGGGGSGNDGSNGALATARTLGGTPGGGGGSGGLGGALGVVAGGPGGDVAQNDGGGGGSVGRIRINASPAGSVNGLSVATFSPGLQDPNTTTTIGSTRVE